MLSDQLCGILVIDRDDSITPLVDSEAHYSRLYPIPRRGRQQRGVREIFQTPCRPPESCPERSPSLKVVVFPSFLGHALPTRAREGALTRMHGRRLKITNFSGVSQGRMDFLEPETLAERAMWCEPHGFDILRSNRTRIYGYGTKLYLITKRGTALDLKALLAKLEASARLISEKDCTDMRSGSRLGILRE